MEGAMMFDFRDMLIQYSQDIVIIDEQLGHYDDNGQWIPGGRTERTVQAPVLNLNKDELQQAEGGTLTRRDRKTYMHERLNEGGLALIDGDEYTITASNDYSFHASGLRCYYLTRRD